MIVQTLTSRRSGKLSSMICQVSSLVVVLDLTLPPGTVQVLEFFKVVCRKFFVGEFGQVGLTCVDPGSVPKRSDSKNGLTHSSLHHSFQFTIVRFCER